MNLNVLDCFTGAGLGSVGLQWLLQEPMQAAAYIENNAYCQQVLIQRMADGMLCPAPIWDDIDTFDGRPWAGIVDAIIGGPPCQGFSIAGKGLGWADPRNKFPAFLRLVKEIRPGIVFFENSPTFITTHRNSLLRLFGAFTKLGYDVRWGTLSACTLGAPHKRTRLWVMAHLRCKCRQEGGQKQNALQRMLENGKACNYNQRSNKAREVMADTDQQGLSQSSCRQKFGFSRPEEKSSGCSPGGRNSTSKRRGWWAIEPGMGRVVDGCSDRVERITALGNGQVPAVAASAFQLEV